MSAQREPEAISDGVIRRLRPSEETLFQGHLLRLDGASRRDRFNGVTDDRFVAAYSSRCFHDGTTVIGYVLDGQVHGAAELHERPELSEPTGEIAFSVEQDLQHQGIGSRLFARVIDSARGAGYERLLVTTHPTNTAMKALAKKFKSRLTFEAGESVGLIELRPNSQPRIAPQAERAISRSPKEPKSRIRDSVPLF